jgi:hypothetical protein
MTSAREDKRSGHRRPSPQQCRAFLRTGERGMRVSLVAAKQNGRAVQLPVMIEQFERRP